MEELKMYKIINHYIELLSNDYEEEEVIMRLIEQFNLNYDDLVNDLSFPIKTVKECLKKKEL